MVQTASANADAISSQVAGSIKQCLLRLAVVDVSFDFQARAVQIAGVFFNDTAGRFFCLPVMLAHPLLSVATGPGDGTFEPVVDYGDQSKLGIERPMALYNCADGGLGVPGTVQRNKNGLQPFRI